MFLIATSHSRFIVDNTISGHRYIRRIGHDNLSSGFQLAGASTVYRIKGIFELPFDLLDREQTIYYGFEESFYQNMDPYFEGRIKLKPKIVEKSSSSLGLDLDLFCDNLDDSLMFKLGNIL